ncbi:MAG TPA: FlgD immunoglobulin-like domain containing protein [Thermoanaerobaculia bacterium]|nr:FlgD immunoglobulin-like domain containing protein [Thermoanaerobaculia bacterium]
MRNARPETRTATGAAFIALLFFGLLPGTATAQLAPAAGGGGGTTVSANITKRTTWTTTGSPYTVTAPISITTAGTLTVNAGVQVKFNTGTSLKVDGTLTAIGTSTSPITFTFNGTGSPGSWGGIAFSSGTGPTASNLTFATISYAGQTSSVTGNTAILVNSSSPTFDHITINACGGDGLTINGSTANPTVRNSSTITGNAGNGIVLSIGGGSGGINISNTSITNNAGYPFNMVADARLPSLTGVTVSGNTGGNAILVGGTISGSTTFHQFAIPWAISGITVSPTGTWTIDPGTTLQFVNSTATIQGTLVAVGTAPAPITITGPPYAVIQFSQAQNASILKYANLTGTSVGIDSCSPTLDHVNISGTSQSAVGITGGNGTVTTLPTLSFVSIQNSGGVNGWAIGVYSYGGLVATNCTLINNTQGVSNSSSGTVSVRLTYWGAASGPSGSGPGTGQSVSTGVTYEPYLTVAPNTTQYFSSFTNQYKLFDPADLCSTRFKYTTPVNGTWTLKIYNGAQLLRTITGADPAVPSWDARDNAGTLQAPGTYTYEVSDTAGSTAGPARGTVTYDPALVSWRWGPFLWYWEYFSPNNDAVQDTQKVRFGTSSEEGWTVDVKNSAGVTVRTGVGTATGYTDWDWDGKNNSGVLQPEGPYQLFLNIQSCGSTVTYAAGTTTLDNTPPVATITAPTNGQQLSNVTANGNSIVNITGTMSDTNMSTWYILGLAREYGSRSGTLYALDTLGYPNGTFPIQWGATDLAGNTKTGSITTTIANFRVEQVDLSDSPAYSFNQPTSTMRYRSIVPFTLTENLFVVDNSNTLVKTLANTSRVAGTYYDTWDGRINSGTFLQDGLYRHKATVTSGTSSMTWDRSSVMRGGIAVDLGIISTSSPFDPYNNSPLQVSYTLSTAYRINLEVGYRNYEFDAICSAVPTTVCLTDGEYQAPGSHTFFWNGMSASGFPLFDKSFFSVIGRLDTFPVNATFMYGNAPVVTNPVFSPALYRPPSGNQTLTFTMSTTGNRLANVYVYYTNSKSLSVVRSIGLSNVSPGTVTVTWDGRADNGMWVAEGPYMVTVIASDAQSGSFIPIRLATRVMY